MPKAKITLNISEDKVAYFSMEIGFRNEIPTYSGGLGILAGDSLKSLADMGVDVVAVTLLSEKGYFYQKFDEQGNQQELDYQWSVESLLNKVDVQVLIKIENRDVYVNVWEYNLKGVSGKSIKILFLDTNDEKNSEHDRTLTSHLYGGDVLYRLQQEIVLGIGGMRVLHELGHRPRMHHLNEGHAAFLMFELYNSLGHIDSFEERKSIIRSLCSFTTHTPVAAGHDSFNKYLLKAQLGDQMPEDAFAVACEGEQFSMTRLAINFSGYTNAVSRKHRDVSRKMFPEFPIDYITNGVHTVTWANKHFAALFDKHIVDWRFNPLELRNVHKIPLDEIDFAHKKAKQELIDFVNTTMNAGLEYDVFTIGFARRATAYKRAELLFKNIERLKELSKKYGPMQLVFAGKAHPRDVEGKDIIRHLHSIIEQLAPTIKMVFVENYNMYIGQLLTSGVDLWLNTPQRPLEASGTSGMKAAANGVPSLSIPDGWWVEGLIEGVTGWSIGSEFTTITNNQELDDADANALYDKLEKRILPLYYARPEDYALVMRNVIAINASYFNTHRMVKQYLVRAYARNN